ncbi:hypothetical protein GOODEAATRI_006554, partial [Goodea atripinnis]
KGYLSSFLSLQYGLQVFGIDSSSTNTHGAQERNRKLKKFSRAYHKRTKAAWTQVEAPASRQKEVVEINPELNQDRDPLAESGCQQEERVSVNASPDTESELNLEAGELFLSALSADVIQPSSPRVPPSQLSAEERERRKRENLEKKTRTRGEGVNGVFSPLTSYVTAQTELRELVTELEVRRHKKVHFENAFFPRDEPYGVVASLIPTATSEITAARLDAVLDVQHVIINKFFHLS